MATQTSASKLPSSNVAMVMEPDMGALRNQTAVNIRERTGRRKQMPVRHLESRSKRIRCLFGIKGIGWSALVA
jgi:hypothetical protein